MFLSFEFGTARKKLFLTFQTKIPRQSQRCAHDGSLLPSSMVHSGAASDHPGASSVHPDAASHVFQRPHSSRLPSPYVKCSLLKELLRLGRPQPLVFCVIYPSPFLHPGAACPSTFSRPRVFLKVPSFMIVRRRATSFVLLGPASLESLGTFMHSHVSLCNVHLTCLYTLMRSHVPLCNVPQTCLCTLMCSHVPLCNVHLTCLCTLFRFV